jgi:hypothetical protein
VEEVPVHLAVPETAAAAAINQDGYSMVLYFSPRFFWAASPFSLTTTTFQMKLR